MKQKLIAFACAAHFFCITGAFCQKTTSVLPITADSLASGNSKDVFRSFFQLALNRITGNNKEIQFSSNPYAVMAKMDTSLLRSPNYLNHTGLRRLNFSFSLKLDSSYKFNGFSSGMKYALVNKRDETVSDQFVRLALNTGEEFFQLNNAMTVYISNFSGDSAKQHRLNAQRNALFAGTTVFSKLDPGLQDVIRKKTAELNADTATLSNANVDALLTKRYNDLRTKFHQRSLWTLGLSDTTYKNQFFSNLVLSTEYLKGLDDPTKPLKPLALEFNSLAAYHFVDDSLQTGRDLHRQILQVEPGVNIVFRTKRALYSFAELKISGSYYHVFSGLSSSKENRDSSTINGTLRIRLINDIWIPLEIKYDWRHGNVFGFLNIRANFSGLKNLFSKEENQSSGK